MLIVAFQSSLNYSFYRNKTFNMDLILGYYSLSDLGFISFIRQTYTPVSFTSCLQAHEKTNPKPKKKKLKRLSTASYSQIATYCFYWYNSRACKRAGTFSDFQVILPCFKTGGCSKPGQFKRHIEKKDHLLFAAIFNHHKNNILALADSQSHKRGSGTSPCFDYGKKKCLHKVYSWLIMVKQKKKK